MAKLTRVPAKVFASSAAADEIGQFGSAVAGAKLETSDVATIQGLSAWLSGWSEALVSGNRYPALQEMNGLLKVLSYQGAYALQEGIAEYDSATTYYIGSIVKKTGTFELYGSLTNDNAGNALTSTTNWKFLVNLNTIGQSGIQFGTCSTAAATVAKDITASGITLLDGLTLLVTMTYANTASSITFSLNSGTAYSLKDLRGNTPDFSNKAGEKVLIRFNLTSSIWELLSAEFYNARMGMPSNSYIDLTLGASGSTYTAPTDGYLLFETTPCTGAGYQRLAIVASGYKAENRITTVGASCIVNIDVKKGDVITITYDTTGTRYFRFYYAEGSKP